MLISLQKWLYNILPELGTGVHILHDTNLQTRKIKHRLLVLCNSLQLIFSQWMQPLPIARSHFISTVYHVYCYTNVH